ncbi:MAG TPA: hypothetical protein VN879_08115 [Candidatus Acidoferrales bacterium]|nr:hypothetical protein [Candidatus Acidoferrales bacterium]
MIGTSSALIGAVVLLVLILVWIRADSTSRHPPSALDAWLPDEGDTVEVCPPEFVSQIFSGQDLAFISRLESPDLKRHFLRERNAVALLWVRQTAAAIHRIMRRHLEASRLSEDIEFAMEARIFLQYAQLRLICALLFLLIGLAGPQRLHGMALSADKLTQRIGNVLREFESGARTGEMDGARSS